MKPTSGLIKRFDSTSRMIERFNKYVVLVMDLPDGSYCFGAFYDEKRFQKGINVLGLDGMVYPIPEAKMNDQQRKFMIDQTDPHGNLGTLTYIYNRFLRPFGATCALFPEPTLPEWHTPEYAAAITTCIQHGKRSYLTRNQIPPFSLDLFDDLVTDETDLTRTRTLW